MIVVLFALLIPTATSWHSMMRSGGGQPTRSVGCEPYHRSHQTTENNKPLRSARLISAGWF
ncbi:hypothetical protein C0081_05540 [Cohaesibacter celericrescens]|uniref:Uncharacterized protein n=1 Tax=Cohaesibacter celericrescens TaxID=2067669 RepID=A0A2N5XUZ3_9HYPH|nr:hypothetical protein C0081_05540 [Cohaesibacter celericrescens]